MTTETAPTKTTRQALRTHEPFEQMRAEMARLWNEPWGLFGWPRRDARAIAMESWAPRVDMFEKGSQLVVKADLPGMKKDDIEVTVDNGDLVIRGERKEEKEAKEDDYYRMERSYGTFHRRIALPFDVDARTIQARFEDCVLEIQIPRPPEPKHLTQKVTVR